MGLLTDGIFHLVIHTVYFAQYLLLTIAVLFGLIWFQFSERRVTGTWSHLFSAHLILHSLLFVYNMIQVLRNTMGILNDPWNIAVATFFYYIKDGFSISVLLVILYIYLKNIYEEKGRKVLQYVFTALSAIALLVTLVFAIVKTATLVSLNFIFII